MTLAGRGEGRQGPRCSRQGRAGKGLFAPAGDRSGLASRPLAAPALASDSRERRAGGRIGHGPEAACQPRGEHGRGYFSLRCTNGA